MAYNTIGDGNPDNIYVTDVWLIDQFIGAKLWGMGDNSSGTLGDGTLVSKSSPVQTIAQGTTWKQASTSGVGSTAAAIKTDGTLWLWGYAFDGELGDNTAVTKSSPVQTIAGGSNWAQVACGAYHVAAVKNDGSLWAWGYNIAGQLGDNTVVAKSSPVQTVASGNTWSQVACGYKHTSAIKTDGSLWMWGANTNGQLGDNTVVPKSSPVQTVAGGTNWKQTACGYSHTAAIKTDGSLWLWGSNVNGTLGDGTVANKSSPVQTVAGGTNWKNVASGQYHTAAIKTDGTLWTWGLNSAGQLGDNTVVPKSSPVQTVAGGTNWKQVSCGYSTVAVKTDGTLWGWGDDSVGQLGDNSIVNKSSPVQTVARGTNWKQVAAGKYDVLAITF